MGYAYPGAEYISDTAAHTGRFGKVVALENTVIASMTADDITGNTLSAVTLNSSCEICGVITSITLTSGSVLAYRL
jgi:hypothetical protein